MVLGGDILTIIEKSIEINTSADKIWPLATWDKIPEWSGIFKSAQWKSLDKNKVGSKVHVVSEVADEKDEFDAEIIEYTDHGEGTQTWKTTDGHFTAAGAIYLKPSGENKTLVMMIEEYRLPYGPIGSMHDRIRVHKAFKDEFEESTRRLKDIAETA
jgi:uncharacterized membrane protein